MGFPWDSIGFSGRISWIYSNSSGTARDDSGIIMDFLGFWKKMVGLSTLCIANLCANDEDLTEYIQYYIITYIIYICMYIIFIYIYIYVIIHTYMYIYIYVCV